ncbi:MAG: tetratricopeptide repeat protein [Bacteroidales bacterium]|nr:tetratricopeptide repeat protein [Bacteroidales bacterium]
MKRNFAIILPLFSILFFACSTQKNTAVTRTYHNVTAHYNVYFNGNESYNAGRKKIETEYKDNYSILLPIFKYSEENALKLASSDMERTLSKMGKTIAVHSITVKPKLKGNMTPKDKEFMKKNEYCKWIDDSYLLIGKADFYKQDYSKALRSFRKIITEYKTEETRFESQLWIAKVYIEQEKYKDAFNYLTELENDVRHPKKLDKEINLTFADYYIRQKEYKKGISRLEAAIKLTKKKDDKARYYYIIAQLEQKLGNNSIASDNFKKVIKLNPNYDMVFSAKIMRATVFTAGQNSADIKKELRKMLKDEKNEEYKDQIYYALATIEQKEDNETEAIKNYKLSASTSVKNDNQKAISFLALADIFFAKKDFVPAGNYYDSTMQYLATNYPDYDLISKKAENTGMLVEYLTVVQVQDSLQKIAKMSEQDRTAFIQQIIEEVKEEERRKQEELTSNQTYDPLDFGNNSQNNNNNQGGKWYMYNPVLVSRGKNEFKKKWGARKLEDDWRRKNKSVLNNIGDEEIDENADSTRVTDNKTVEYYLQDLPLNDSLLEISNDLIINALFNAADVYENRLDDGNAAIRTYEELMNRYPDNYLKLETYYRLHKLYQKKTEETKANYYKELIVIQYPDSKYSKMLLDPNFYAKLMATENDALNLYDKTLSEYKSNDYNQTLVYANEGIKKYPDSQAYPNFLFLKAKAFGNTGRQDSMVFYFKEIVKHFPKSDIGILSKEILTLIESGKYDYDIYKIAPLEEHYFVVIIDKTQNTTEFKFKLKLKVEQFTNTKAFEIEDENFSSKKSLIKIKTFDNQKEVESFYKSVIDSDAFENIDKSHVYFISKTNYDLFIKDKMLDKYDSFFKKNYSLTIQ